MYCGPWERKFFERLDDRFAHRRFAETLTVPKII